MKSRLYTILLFFIILLVFSGCGNVSNNVIEENSGNSFTSYINNGYTYTGISSNQYEGESEILKIWLNSSDKTDCILMDFTLSDDDSSEWNKIDISSETYESDINDFLKNISSDKITITSLNNNIPSSDEMNKYIGMTLDDLNNDGYEWYANEEDSNGGLVMVYFNPVNNISFGISVDKSIDNLFDLSDDEISKVVITGIKFWGFEAN